jgi:hypothetical protein
VSEFVGIDTVRVVGISLSEWVSECEGEGESGKEGEKLHSGVEWVSEWVSIMKGYAEASEEMRYDRSEWVSECLWECSVRASSRERVWQSDNSPPRRPTRPASLTHPVDLSIYLSFLNLASEAWKWVLTNKSDRKGIRKKIDSN